MYILSANKIVSLYFTGFHKEFRHPYLDLAWQCPDVESSLHGLQLVFIAQYVAVSRTATRERSAEARLWRKPPPNCSNTVIIDVTAEAVGARSIKAEACLKQIK